jgi:hypothetical protein
LDADFFEAVRDDFLFPRTRLRCFADDMAASIIPQKEAAGFGQDGPDAARNLDWLKNDRPTQVRWASRIEERGMFGTV